MNHGPSLVSSEHMDFIDDKSAALLLSTPKSARILLWIIISFFILAIVWASFAKLDKVTTGSAKVIPSSQLQIVQNLEGGIVKEMLIKEGQSVVKGQKLLLIDDTLFQSSFREKSQDLASLKADSIRLRQIIRNIVIDNSASDWQSKVKLNVAPLVFDGEFSAQHASLILQEQNEYHDVMANFQNELNVTAQQIKQKQQELNETKSRANSLASNYSIIRREYNMTKPLADEGVVPRIELLKLQRSMNDSQRELTSARMQLPVIESEIQETTYKYTNIASDFRTKTQQELSDVSNKLSSMSEMQVGLQDKVTRTVVTSPVTGTIQKIHVNTIGGVIQPGMDLIEIVPTEDSLLIETKIAPQDIGFLYPGLKAIIKFTAYDFTNYGGLEGTLETISADTIQDEEGNSFYQVKIRTDENSLHGPTGTDLPIIPGMTASADIITGKRTVLDYLLKPVLKARQTALRE
ncbi:HlyD family type I secretion periplasmic adaptor subunit [Vibrio rumoiensis]|uniref:Membrane fusion protein (MFP) family protein n=1 Tax=Vibrio rumoiensis 1S-45 TaxID=1188252 RepID=A0A1E5E024_9VIBR|nr:HlyD family type I secretion periplasmic adaptor subunit [Vibrio rumoiensis]OEF23301.1 hemolysin secretion protein D [Vibrio rumoiensis 1S-45]